ncbi:ATP-binding cassette domain-containing protein [Proteiniborus sp. MB09-C3]|uniref:ATP-binding cassette domain-containing protein n=1 Tax=Proteiniborus sp. MB09-C3 TaxID=3050072 RepID=UPI002553CE1E|nr:ATP-binding cassette domain-containing protein [Proteiniborus sp. MB09-C3]WIV11497.1 ATP-binding cassette domain-containing protein [Proteiniborus sp. MB09-C3]
MGTVLEVNSLKKSFGERVLFNDLSFKVEEGSFVGFVGKSGSGKSTLLNILGLLDKHTSGDYILLGNKNISIKSRLAQQMLRKEIGYMFQNYALLENETVESNLKIGMRYGKYDNRKSAIDQTLEEIQLTGVKNRKVHTLSGGEQQRIALGRLLLKPCSIVLADEPTGNLDKTNKYLVMDLFQTLRNKGKTVLVVTHDLDLLPRFDVVFNLDDIN